MCVYNTYGKRIINGFIDARSAGSLNAVDKEALLNCLIECRILSRMADRDRSQKEAQTEQPVIDRMQKYLIRYRNMLQEKTYPLAELDMDVTELLEIVFGSGDDSEIATKIRNAYNAKSLSNLGKRKSSKEISIQTPKRNTFIPLRKRDNKRKIVRSCELYAERMSIQMKRNEKRT